jgi:hypothetical protein
MAVRPKDEQDPCVPAAPRTCLELLDVFEWYVSRAPRSDDLDPLATDRDPREPEAARESRRDVSQREIRDGSDGNNRRRRSNERRDHTPDPEREKGDRHEPGHPRVDQATRQPHPPCSADAAVARLEYHDRRPYNTAALAPGARQRQAVRAVELRDKCRLGWHTSEVPSRRASRRMRRDSLRGRWHAQAKVVRLVDQHRAEVELEDGRRWTVPMPEWTEIVVGMGVSVTELGDRLIVTAGPSLIEAVVVEIVDERHGIVELGDGRRSPATIHARHRVAVGAKVALLDTTMGLMFVARSQT